jgi:hypothetical protein
VPLRGVGGLLREGEGEHLAGALSHRPDVLVFGFGAAGRDGFGAEAVGACAERSGVLDLLSGFDHGLVFGGGAFGDAAQQVHSGASLVAVRVRGWWTGAVNGKARSPSW